MSIVRLGKGPRMSTVIIHNNVVYLSGQIGEGSTVADQTFDALATVDKWLSEAGTDKSRTFSVAVWLADMNDYQEMNDVYDRWIDSDTPPARTAAELKLASPELLVEFMVFAAR